MKTIREYQLLDQRFKEFMKIAVIKTKTGYEIVDTNRAMSLVDLVHNLILPVVDKLEPSLLGRTGLAAFEDVVLLAADLLSEDHE